MALAAGYAAYLAASGGLRDYWVANRALNAAVTAQKARVRPPQPPVFVNAGFWLAAVSGGVWTAVRRTAPEGVRWAALVGSGVLGLLVLPGRTESRSAVVTIPFLAVAAGFLLDDVSRRLRLSPWSTAVIRRRHSTNGHRMLRGRGTREAAAAHCGRVGRGPLRPLSRGPGARLRFARSPTRVGDSSLLGASPDSLRAGSRDGACPFRPAIAGGPGRTSGDPGVRSLTAREAHRGVAGGHWPWGAVVAAGGGATAFVLVCGARVLDVTRVGWLSEGDPAWHFMGWEFFRRGDWRVPPGLNPGYGLEIGSSIFYSDSIPLLALPAKMLRLVVDVPQYFGAWLLLCFVLQALLSWCLLGRATRDPVLRLFGAGVFVFAPAFLWRLHGHYALSAHWVVLGGLLLCTTPSGGRLRRPATWAALAGAAGAVHGYLLAMAIALWLADLVRRRLEGRGAVAILFEVVSVGGTVLLVLWAVGFFVLGAGGVRSGGYGDHALDLLGFVNPLGGWSRVLPALPVVDASTESHSVFLGLGGLWLTLAGAWAAATRPRLLRARRRLAPLLATLALLLVFAASHRVAVWGAVRLTLPLPEPLLDLCGQLRGSVRMAWPAYYALVTLATALVARRWSRNTAGAVLLAALLLQVVDTSQAWCGIRARMQDAPASWPDSLPDGFWTAAAERYRRVRLLPPSGLPTPPYWARVAWFAATHGLSTDAASLARVDYRALAGARAASRAALTGGRFEPDTLYVVTDSFLGAAALAAAPGADLLAEVDGVVVLAPGWKRTSPVPAGAHEIGPDRLAWFEASSTGFTPGLRRRSARFGAVALPLGWGVPDAGGVWTTDYGAVLMLSMPAEAGEELQVRLLGSGFVTARHPEQRVRIRVRGRAVAEWRFTSESPSGWRPLTLARSLAARERDGTLAVPLELDLPDAARPVDVGFNFDSRLLAYRLEGLETGLAIGAPAGGSPRRERGGGTGNREPSGLPEPPRRVP